MTSERETEHGPLISGERGPPPVQPAVPGPIDLPTLLEFRVGEPVPGWILSVRPGGGESDAVGVLRWGTEVIVRADDGCLVIERKASGDRRSLLDLRDVVPPASVVTLFLPVRLAASRWAYTDDEWAQVCEEGGLDPVLNDEVHIVMSPGVSVMRLGGEAGG